LLVELQGETLDPATSDGSLLAHAVSFALGKSQIARKVNFAIQLLREASELLETSPRSRRSTFSTNRSRYPRRPSAEREE
jgi:hypothetical protein